MGVYAFTLRLTDGTLTASLPTQVSVGEPEKSGVGAVVAQIAAGDFNWFANTIDWDGDGIANPYDWTPTVNADGVTINLTLGLTGEGGTEIQSVADLQCVAVAGD